MLRCLGVTFIVLLILGLAVIAWPLALAVLFVFLVIAIVKAAFR